MDSLVMQAAGPLVKGMAGGEVIRDMFQDASKRGVGQLLLYLNSDMLLDESAAHVVEKLQDRPRPSLGSARRWCLPRWSEVTPASELKWRSFFRSAERSGRWGEACALDMSDEMRVIHCDHDYSYAKGNTAPGRRDIPLEEGNLKMLGGENRLFHLGHATHKLRHGTVRRCRSWGSVQRSMELWQIQHPGQRWWWGPVRRFFHPLIKRWQARTTRTENWNRRSRKISHL